MKHSRRFAAAALVAAAGALSLLSATFAQAGNFFPTFSTTTLTSEIERQFQISIHPTAPLRFLKIELTWSAEIDQITCNAIPDGVALTVEHEHEPRFKSTSTIDFGDAGLQQSQRIWVCTAIVQQDTDEGGQPEIKIIEATGLDGNPLPGPESVCADCRVIFEPSRDPDWTDPPNEYDTCGVNYCGDANSSLSYGTSDALWVLRGAVGEGECPPQRCDVDRSGDVVAGDALRVLQRAVGLPRTLLCDPPPASDCAVYPTVLAITH